MTQHMTTCHTSSGIGMDHGGCSDARIMAVVISEMIIDKAGSSDAPESPCAKGDLSVTTDTTDYATEPTADAAGGAQSLLVKLRHEHNN